MKGSFYILVDGAKVPVIRNPYERIITMYREKLGLVWTREVVRKTNY